MTNEEFKEFVKEEVVFKTFNTETSKSGHSTHPLSSQVTVICDKLGINMEINIYKSMYNNKQFGLKEVRRQLENNGFKS